MTSLMIQNTLTINAIDLYYEIHGTGKPLLLLHGFTGTGAALIPLFQDLTNNYQLIIPDLRGHGRSTNPSNQFTHRQAALDIFGLLDHLNISQVEASGFSAGGNILLHMATQQPDRIKNMAIVSATPYFPDEARNIMRQFKIKDRSQEEWQAMRTLHLQGDEQIKMLWKQANAFGDNYDDMNLTPLDLEKINTKTLIVQGDRDPFYPVEISVDMYRQISSASLWIVPNGGHVPLSNDLMPMFKHYLLNMMM